MTAAIGWWGVSGQMSLTGRCALGRLGRASGRVELLAFCTCASCGLARARGATMAACLRPSLPDEFDEFAQPMDPCPSGRFLMNRCGVFVLGLVWSCIAVFAFAVAPAAQAASPLTWSSPRLVDHVAPFGHSKGLFGVSCPSRSLCVGPVDHGVVTSTDATSQSPSWTLTKMAEDPIGISCPTSSLCVAIDYQGNVISSTDPTGGSTAWKAVAITTPQPYNMSRTRTGRVRTFGRTPSSHGQV